MSPMVKQPLMLEHSLLGFLRQRSMHAYEIYQTLNRARALGLVWRLKQSQLYALLSRLEQASYIGSTLEPQGSRPPRKVMHLTPKGRAAFERWLTSPVEHGRDFRLEFLAKLFFAAQEAPETVTELIAAQRDVCQTSLAGLLARARTIRTERSYDWLVLKFRIGQLEAMLAWLDTCAETLAPSPPAQD